MQGNRFLAAAAAAAVACAGGSGAATISIDQSVKYQVIEGLGAYAAMAKWKVRSGPFWVDVDLESTGLYDSVFSELGLSMLRTMADPFYNPSPGVWDAANLESATPDAATGFAPIRRFQAAADANHEPLRWITHVWSPPGWMKVSGVVPGGIEASPDYNATDCKLIEGLDDEFAHYLRRYVEVIRDSCGVDYYGVSMQDEPAFQEPYTSCVYSPQRYAATLRAVVDTFSAAGMLGRNNLFGAEHMMWAYPSAFEGQIRQDPVALAGMHAWAIHGYSDGVRADTGSYAGATATDKPLWMSSTSGPEFGSGTSDWTGAMTLGRSILRFLRDSKGSAWTWFTLQESCGNLGCESTEPGAYCLILNGTRTAKYYVSTHFYRYVRPGARQVKCALADASLMAVAFTHEQNNCLTVVVINSDTANARSIEGVAGSGVPAQLELIQSTADRKLWRDTVDATATVSLPPASITTLVAGTYKGTGPLAVQQLVPQARRPAASRVGARISAERFDLLGKRMPAAAIGRPAAGAVVERVGGSTVRRVVWR